VKRQREAAQAVAERLGATIEREYVDRGGAVDLDRRNTLLTMLGDLISGPPIVYVLTHGPGPAQPPRRGRATIEDALTEARATENIGDDRPSDRGPWKA
jgi:hypothetical protein